jgi:hypothetical protein
MKNWFKKSQVPPPNPEVERIISEAMRSALAKHSEYEKAIAHVIIPEQIKSLSPIYHEAYKFIHTSSEPAALAKKFKPLPQNLWVKTLPNCRETTATS